LTWSHGMSLLLCDDHRVFADSLAYMLSLEGFEVADVVASPNEAASYVARKFVDLCLMDLHFPDGDGIFGARLVRDARPCTRVVILTASTDTAVLSKALLVGVRGFVHKGEPVSELVRALRAVQCGDLAISSYPEQFDQRRIAFGSDKARLYRQLTPRERECLEVIVSGRSTREVAGMLDISYNTARTHIQNVLGKLGVNSCLEAAAFAVRHGLVDASAH
jgi:two-component system, NarL family, nitrate/nitrite response regulator NarL